MDSHLSYGRSCACVAKVSDEKVHDLFAGKLFLTSQEPDSGHVERFELRHQSCHYCAVKKTLNLDILRVCGKIYQIGQTMPFEENVFTLSRPGSLPPFLERLAQFQREALRCLRIYSTSRHATAWIGPLPDQGLGLQLLGLRRLEIHVEPADFEADNLVRCKRLSGLRDLFRGTKIGEVELWLVGEETRDFGWRLLREETVERVEEWKEELREMLVGV